jgi:hypothetical protein
VRTGAVTYDARYPETDWHFSDGSVRGSGRSCAHG